MKEAAVKVIVATPVAAETERWQGIMQAALPEFEVIAWRPGMSDTLARYAIVWSPPDDLFRDQPGLRAVFNLGAGVDGIMRLPSLTPDTAVYRLQDAGMAGQMAEYVIHAIAELSRGFETYRRRQNEAAWSPLPAVRHAEWPVGVMGLGKLGSHVAQSVAALGYPVAGWARSPRDHQGIDTFHGDGQLDAFLARTRVLVNLLPLTAETAGIINAALIAKLKPHAVLINIARGGHVVDADVLAALDSGQLQSAVLDVFNDEPLPQDHPYWRHPRVRITPHVAAVTLEDQAVQQITEGIRLLERGQQAPGLVARDTGY